MDHNELWKILQKMGISDHFTCLLRNLYVCQEATVKTEHGTTDWPQTGKGVHQGCILPPYLFNLCMYMYMQSIHLVKCWLDESRDRIKIARRNINNLRYEDDTTLMAENEELKRLLRKLKEESEKLA